MSSLADFIRTHWHEVPSAAVIPDDMEFAAIWPGGRRITVHIAVIPFAVLAVFFIGADWGMRFEQRLRHERRNRSVERYRRHVRLTQAQESKEGGR